MIWALLFLFAFVDREENCHLVTKNKAFYAVFLIIFFLMPIILSAASSFYIAVVAARARLAEAMATQMVTTIANPQADPIADEECNILQPMVSKKTSGSRRQREMSTARSESVTAIAVVPWRTITFVFTSTIWSTLTYLPYRISFVISKILETQDSWQLALFASMVVCAAGNPIITIVTQPSYRRRVVEVFQLLKSNAKRVSNTNL